MCGVKINRDISKKHVNVAQNWLSPVWQQYPGALHLMQWTTHGSVVIGIDNNGTAINRNGERRVAVCGRCSNNRPFYPASLYSPIPVAVQNFTTEERQELSLIKTYSVSTNLGNTFHCQYQGDVHLQIPRYRFNENRLQGMLSIIYANPRAARRYERLHLIYKAIRQLTANNPIIDGFRTRIIQSLFEQMQENEDAQPILEHGYIPEPAMLMPVIPDAFNTSMQIAYDRYGLLTRRDGEQVVVNQNNPLLETFLFPHLFPQGQEGYDEIKPIGVLQQR